MSPAAAETIRARTRNATAVCRAVWLGTVPYDEAWSLQRRLGEMRTAGEIPDTLLLLEHPHTYTLGRLGKAENVLLTEEELEGRGARLLRVDRGGDVTYHGPGQLVGYPIMLVEDRRDLLGHIRRLEEVIIRTLHDYGIDGSRVDALSGVWVGEAKIAAIGVKMGKVTTHGFALNVSTDLTYFDSIVPCGIRDKGVTSMAMQGWAASNVQHSTDEARGNESGAEVREPQGTDPRLNVRCSTCPSGETQAAAVVSEDRAKESVAFNTTTVGVAGQVGADLTLPSVQAVGWSLLRHFGDVFERRMSAVEASPTLASR